MTVFYDQSLLFANHIGGIVSNDKSISCSVFVVIIIQFVKQTFCVQVESKHNVKFC